MDAVAEREIVIGDLVIDLEAREVTVAGEPVHLARKEYELLVFLAERPRMVFTKEELMDAIWPDVPPDTTRTLNSHAIRLRKKLARGGPSRFVINCYGVGYRLFRPPAQVPA